MCCVLTPRLAHARAWLAALLLLVATLASGANTAQAASITTGGSHFCAITEARQLACWGYGSYGALGTGDEVDRPRPTLVAGLSDVRSVAASSTKSCAVTGDGRAWCWGWGRVLGTEAFSTQLQPEPVTGIEGVVDLGLSQGGDLCVLLRDRTVQCRVGPAFAPSGWRLVDGATDVVEISGYCMRRGDGTVGCLNDGPRSPLITVAGLHGATSFSATGNSVCGTFADGSMRCSLERPDFTGNGKQRRDTTARRVPHLSDATKMGTGPGVCVVRGGPVTCTNPSNLIETAPSRTGGLRVIAGIDDANEVASTGAASCAVRTGGAIACWGGGPEATGNGAAGFAATPVEVWGLGNATALSAGRDGRTCALRLSGRVACWGVIAYGPSGPQSMLTATDVPGLKDAQTLSQGDYVSCATTRRRALVCWGPAAGDAPRSTRPTTIGLLPRGASPLRSIPGCFTVKRRARCVNPDVHTLRRSGAVLRQQRVRAFDGATSIASSSSSFDCAVLDDATVSCRGTTWLEPSYRGMPSTPPTPLPSITGVRSLSPRETGSCAILFDKTATCWGPADSRRLPGFTDVRALASTGPNGPCAVLGNGTVICTRPPVETPTSGDVPTGPYVMPGISDAIDIVAGYSHACVLRSGGTVACWGDGRLGALGDGPAPTGHGPQTRPATLTDIKGLPTL